MNRDLALLAEKAGLYFRFPSGMFYPAALTAEQSQEAIEKFAELIIKECAKQCINSHPADLPFMGGMLLRKFNLL